MEQQKETTSDFIEIEAPTHLEVGQNFYDQPPFNKILKTVSEKTETREENLRRFLRSITRSQKYGDILNNFKVKSPEEIEKWGRTAYKYHDMSFLKNLASKKATSSEKVKYFEAIIEIGIALANYPYWDEYIGTQRSDDFYAYDGEYRPSTRATPILPETYANWVSKKIARQQRQVLLGIDEIFPQHFGQEQVTVPQKGEKKATRRWKILKASELIPERR